MVGRNKVVYSLGAASKPYVTWPGDCVAHVASYLPLDDLCLGSMRCVDKEWRFHSDRSLRLRLDEVKAEIARSDGPARRGVGHRTARGQRGRTHPTPRALRERGRASARALDEEGTCHGARTDRRRACRLAAAVHGVVLGPAYVSYPRQMNEGCVLFSSWRERVLYVEWRDDYSCALEADDECGSL